MLECDPENGMMGMTLDDMDSTRRAEAAEARIAALEKELAAARRMAADHSSSLGLAALMEWKRRAEAAEAALSPAAGQPKAGTAEYRKSDGTSDHYVTLTCGDREMTLFCHHVAGRAEYEAAEINWLIEGGDKPFILDYETDDPGAADPAARRKAEAVADDDGGEFFLVERDDDMLLCQRKWNLFMPRCIARKPKLASNSEWRPTAAGILKLLRGQTADRRKA